MLPPSIHQQTLNFNMNITKSLKLAAIGVVAAAFMSVAHAQTSNTATQAQGIIIKALTCQLKDGQAASVVKALKSLGARLNTQTQKYILKEPISVAGVMIDNISVSESDGETPDTYIATFHNKRSGEIAAQIIAEFRPTKIGRSTDFSIEKKHGELFINQMESDAWLGCATR